MVDRPAILGSATMLMPSSSSTRTSISIALIESIRRSSTIRSDARRSRRTPLIRLYSAANASMMSGAELSLMNPYLS